MGDCDFNWWAHDVEFGIPFPWCLCDEADASHTGPHRCGQYFAERAPDGSLKRWKDESITPGCAKVTAVA